jgi:hypothetical protein
MKKLFLLIGLLALSALIIMSLAVYASPIDGSARLSVVHAASAVAAPVAKVQYFAEGRVGGNGFRQWLTVANPGSSTCRVNVDYYYTLDGALPGSTKTVSFNVDALTRHTQNVNNDLNISPSAGTGATLSAKVYVDDSTPTCNGVIAERPMYFNGYHAVSSGTDVLGASSLNTAFYFADIPTHAAGNTFVSVLNASANPANVTITYYANGSALKTETLNVGAFSRGTFQPGNSDLPAHVAAAITSDRPVMVERPSYFTSSYGVSGSADQIGATALSGKWLFADGLTSNSVQTNLAVANLGDKDATATITLKSLNGSKQDYPVTLAAKSQMIWDVNAHNSFLGSTSEVSIEVNSDTSTLVAQRQIFNNYNSGSFVAQGITDVMGVLSASKSVSFAEGFTSVGFDEQLALYNPGSVDTAVSVTLVNMLSHTTTQVVTVKAGSRATINITQMVKDHLVQAGDDSRAYAVSMAVNSEQPIVAERVMHWNAFSTQGASAVTGYAG